MAAARRELGAMRMSKTLQLSIKRAYLPPAPSDGRRVLVDRLWPRGLSRQEAELDDWMKAVAPTPDLRKWFGHDPERFAEFRRLYRLELSTNSALADLMNLAKQGPLTLLYAAKDERHNHALVLSEYMMEMEGAGSE